MTTLAETMAAETPQEKRRRQIVAVLEVIGVYTAGQLVSVLFLQYGDW